MWNHIVFHFLDHLVFHFYITPLIEQVIAQKNKFFYAISKGTKLQALNEPVDSVPPVVLSIFRTTRRKRSIGMAWFGRNSKKCARTAIPYTTKIKEQLFYVCNAKGLASSGTRQLQIIIIWYSSSPQAYWCLLHTPML